MGVEVFLGAKRGAIHSGIRAGLWLVGSALAALLARVIAKPIVTAILRANGGAGNKAAAVMGTFAADKGLDAGIADSISGPAAGWVMSLAIPVVFVVLYFIFKLMTFLLGLLVEYLMDKNKSEDDKKQVPVWSRIVGGLVGAILALVSCAVLVSPLSGVTHVVRKSGNLDAVLNTITIVSDDSGDTASMIEDFYNSVESSPAAYVLRYTGAEAIANGVYSINSRVSSSYVGADEAETKRYSFPDMLSGIMNISESAEKVLRLIDSDNYTIRELTDSMEVLVMSVVKTELLEDNDKLGIVNASADTLSRMIAEGIGFKDLKLLEHYRDYDSFVKDVERLFKVVGKIGDLASGYSSFDDINIDKLVSDRELLTEFIHETLQISNGAEIISEITNSSIAEISAGRYENIINPDIVKKAGEVNVIETLETLGEMQQYIDRSYLSDDEIEDIRRKADDLEAYGIIESDTILDILNQLGDYGF